MEKIGNFIKAMFKGIASAVLIVTELIRLNKYKIIFISINALIILIVTGQVAEFFNIWFNPVWIVASDMVPAHWLVEIDPVYTSILTDGMIGMLESVLTYVYNGWNWLTTQSFIAELWTAENIVWVKGILMSPPIILIIGALTRKHNALTPDTISPLTVATLNKYNFDFGSIGFPPNINFVVDGESIRIKGSHNIANKSTKKAVGTILASYKNLLLDN